MRCFFGTLGLLTLIALAPPLVVQAGEAGGTFVGASNHITTGTVAIVESDGGYEVVLGEDFSLDGAPDPKLGFGTDGQYDDSTTFAILENLTGSQTYELPASIDPSAHNEFYIWCEKFAVPLGVAKLN